MTVRAFWDETTREGLHWSDVWARFVPLSRAGQRYKRERRPYLAGEREAWAAAAADWQSLRRVDGDWKQRLSELLRDLPDVRDLFVLMEQGAGLRQVDFFELKRFLWKGLQAEELLREAGLAYAWWEAAGWEQRLRQLHPQGELVPTFSMSDLPDEELAGLRRELARLDAVLLAGRRELAEQLRTRYGKAPARDGQYVLDLRIDRDAIAAARSDEDLHLVQENLFEAVFAVVEPPALAAAKEERERVIMRIEDREMIVLQELVREFAPHVERLRRGLDALARLDWALCAARVADEWAVMAGADEGRDAGEEASAGAGTCAGTEGGLARNGNVWPCAGPVTPEWADGDDPWQLAGAWHPQVRQAVEARGGAYTPLDLTLRPGVGLITGPNMGGKTIALRTFGLLQALAQLALPVPAAGFRFQPVNRIGMSGGDEQNVASGLSSFGGEMNRLAALLREPGRALLLLDEVARTTNPAEGEALAAGLAGHLIDSEHVALLASHFPGVASVEGIQSFRIAGLRRDVIDTEAGKTHHDLITRLQSAMDYRLLPCTGEEIPRDALRLAGHFGLPGDVLGRAQARLDRGRREGP